MSKQKLPEEVALIFKEVQQLQYKLLKDAGWCVSCYREPASETVRCLSCQSKYTKAQEGRNRKAGCKPWKAGMRGRPPQHREVEDVKTD